MADEVFIAYARADHARVQEVATALLEETIQIWLDRALRSGEFFPDKINEALDGCKVVLCVWSKESIRSNWVRSEALIGFERKVLVPVRIEACPIPVPFNGMHALDLTGWGGDKDHPEWRALLESLSDFLGRGAMREWARRTRPTNLSDLARIYHRYRDDPLSPKLAELARASFNVDIATLTQAAEEQNFRAVTPADYRVSDASLYEAKRRQMEEQKLASIAADLEDFRDAVEAAHRVRRLGDDLQKLFPAWDVSIEFDCWDEMFEELLASARANASERELREAYDSLFEEDKDGEFVHPHYGEVAGGLSSGRVRLQCGDLSFHVWYKANRGLNCELDQTWQHRIDRFSPPALDDVVEQSGSSDYFSTVSRLASWVRDRFVEYCAAVGTEPTAFQGKHSAHATIAAPSNPNGRTPKRSHWAVGISFVGLAAAVFAVMLTQTREFGAAAALALVGTFAYTALVMAQAIQPTDDTRVFLIKFWFRVPFQILLFLLILFAFFGALAIVLNWLGIE